MIPAILAIAWRELGRNVMRTALTMLGIVIGVAAVVTMMTLGHAAGEAIKAQIASLGTNLLVIVPTLESRGPMSSAASALSVDDARAIEREVSAISRVAPSSSRPGVVVYADRRARTQIIGAPPDYFAIRNYALADGVFLSPFDEVGGATACNLGATLYRRLFHGQTAVGETVRVGSLACRVVGVLQSKGQSTFGSDADDFLVMPLSTFQQRIAGNHEVGVIFATATSAGVSRAKGELEWLMRERRRIASPDEDDFQVQDMKEVNDTLGAVTAVLTGLLGAVAGVSLVVGGVGIMNVMLVAVTERTREIGVRMAIGARAHEVLLQFLIEAMMLSLFGGAIGTGIGLLASYGVTRAIGLPFHVLFGTVAVALGFSSLIGAVFGILPARRAANLRPIEALRHE